MTVASDAHEAWSAASLPPERTVAIGFSHSGATADTVKYLEIARQNGALTVAVTSAEHSPLAAAADEVLMAHHDTEITEGDHVILFLTDRRHVEAVEKLFQAGVSFI